MMQISNLARIVIRNLFLLIILGRIAFFISIFLEEIVSYFRIFKKIIWFHVKQYFLRFFVSLFKESPCFHFCFFDSVVFLDITMIFILIPFVIFVLFHIAEFL